MTRFEDRFWSKVDLSGDCWLWTASLGSTGYGQFNVERKAKKAHRVAYELTHGPIPEGLVIDHLCFEPRCVNPFHLEPVTNAENLRRAEAAGRMAVNGARNRAKTHCPRNHPYSGPNLLVVTTPDGRTRRRRCRECENAARRQGAA